MLVAASKLGQPTGTTRLRSMGGLNAKSDGMFFRGREDIEAWTLPLAYGAFQKWRASSKSHPVRVSRREFFDIFTDYGVIDPKTGTFLTLPMFLHEKLSREPSDAPANGTSRTATLKLTAPSHALTHPMAYNLLLLVMQATVEALPRRRWVGPGHTPTRCSSWSLCFVQELSRKKFAACLLSLIRNGSIGCRRPTWCCFCRQHFMRCFL